MQNRKRDTDVQNRLLDSVGEGEGGMFQENSFETCILSRVKQITSPGWMHRQVLRAGALGRPRGIGWRRRWEWGSGWRIHVNPWLIHVSVWQNPPQYCKVISLKVTLKSLSFGLFWWPSGLEFACQCRGHGFGHWSGKIPHTLEQLNLCSTITEPACLEPMLCKKKWEWEAHAPQQRVAPAYHT